MDIVRFPVATGSTTVAQALVMMREEHVSGIVVPLDQHVNLVGYGDLIAQQIPRRLRLSRLEPIRVAPVIRPAYATRMNLHRAPSMQIGQGELRKIQTFMLKSGYTFATFGRFSRTDRHANILSLRDTNLDLFRLAPMDCYCTNPHLPHPYGPNHPEFCTYDRTKIVC